MRRAGIDEHYIAGKYVGVADKLTKNENKDSGEKLLVDILKEFTRVLDPPKTSGERAAERLAERAAGADAPTPIILVHHVDRPERKASAAPPDDPAVPTVE
jgi:hypothetical protein